MHKKQRTKRRQIWMEIRWMVIGLLWLMGLLAGYTGFAFYAREHALAWTWSDVLYRTLQLIILESGSLSQRVNPLLDMARFLLPALTVYTGLQALMHVFQEQLQWLHLWRMHDHIIVCGLGRKGSRLAETLLSVGYRVVMIDQDANKAKDMALRQRGGVTICADATNGDTLARARMQRASHVICLLGGDHENLRVAFQAHRLAGERHSKPLSCVVHLSSPDLLELLKTSALGTHAEDNFQLQVFNPYEHTARWLINQDAGFGADTAASASPEHVLIIGVGRLGERIAVQAAYNWHLHQRRPKLKITVLDRRAEEKKQSLMQRYARMADVCQIQAVPLSLETISTLQSALEKSAAAGPVQRVYICLGDALLGFQVCLAVLQHPLLKGTPVFIRMGEESGLSGLLDQPAGLISEGPRVMQFDLYEQACSVELVMGGTLELLARSLHEHYLAGSRTGDAAVLPEQGWDELAEEQKEDNRRQAQRIERLLEEAGYLISPLHDWLAAELRFDEKELLSMARREHEHWRMSKQAQGWRFEAERDQEKRTHPDLVDWEQLTVQEQEKNLHFVRHLPHLLAQCGFQLDRKRVDG